MHILSLYVYTYVGDNIFKILLNISKITCIVNHSPRFLRHFFRHKKHLFNYFSGNDFFYLGKKCKTKFIFLQKIHFKHRQIKDSNVFYCKAKKQNSIQKVSGTAYRFIRNAEKLFFMLFNTLQIVVTESVIQLLLTKISDYLRKQKYFYSFTEKLQIEKIRFTLWQRSYFALPFCGGMQQWMQQRKIFDNKVAYLLLFLTTDFNW